MQRPIYLDNHATTPLDPRVLEAMLPFFKEEFGNPSSSTHAFGWRARAAVEKARAQVANLIGAKPDEIYFTSGATESNNWAIAGLLKDGDHVVTTAFEHRSVLACIAALEARHISSTVVSLLPSGQLDADVFASALKPNTRLISIMLANNEIGTLLPVASYARMAHKHGALVHCDAVQAAGKVSIDVDALGVDFLALSAHKVYGPKGIGALYIRRDKKEALAPLIYGGGQESGLRGGTLHVPGIVGFGAAAAIAKAELVSENERIKALRDRLWAKMQDMKGVHLNGALTDRLCGNLNVSFDGVDGEMMLLELQNALAISASSACSSAAHKGSHVLRALGLSGERVSAAFRIGIGRFNTEAEIDRAAEVLAIAQQKARC